MTLVNLVSELTAGRLGVLRGAEMPGFLGLGMLSDRHASGKWAGVVEYSPQMATATAAGKLFKYIVIISILYQLSYIIFITSFQFFVFFLPDNHSCLMPDA